MRICGHSRCGHDEVMGVGVWIRSYALALCLCLLFVGAGRGGPQVGLITQALAGSIPASATTIAFCTRSCGLDTYGSNNLVAPWVAECSILPFPWEAGGQEGGCMLSFHVAELTAPAIFSCRVCKQLK